MGTEGSHTGVGSAASAFLQAAVEAGTKPDGEEVLVGEPRLAIIIGALKTGRRRRILGVTGGPIDGNQGVFRSKKMLLIHLLGCLFNY